MSDSQTANIAVTGLGGWGKNIARDLLAMGKLGAVITSTDGRVSQSALAWAAEHPEVQVMSWEDALANPAINGVAIATPIDTHVDLTLAALNSGKGVYCEKPVALRGMEIKEILESADDLPLLVGHQMLYHPAFQQMRADVINGNPGVITEISASRLFVSTRYPEDVTANLMPHDLAMVINLMDGQNISCLQIQKFQDNEDDPVHTTAISGQRGVPAINICASRVHSERSVVLKVTGSQETLIFDGVANSYTKMNTQTGTEISKEVFDVAGVQSPLYLALADFVKVIEGPYKKSGMHTDLTVLTDVLERTIKAPAKIGRMLQETVLQLTPQ